MDLSSWYHYYNTELADKRTNNWSLVSSPVPILLMSCVYLHIVLQSGPNYMRDKKPYSLHTFVRLYNVFQIVANGLIVYHILDAGWYEDFFIYCTDVNYSMEPKAYKLAKIAWYVLCLKLIDFIETCLFVLRKKNQQVSFLHLYHHISTLICVWLITKYFAHGMAITAPLVNCAVHVIMYTYYLLSSFGPNIQRMLAVFKPMITIVQIVQFWVLIIYFMQLFLPNCHGMTVIGGILIIDLLINFVLFCNFYKKTYISKKQKTQELKSH